MHGTGETMPVVVEQLPVVVVKYLLSAFAGAIDKIAKARPTTNGDAVFMAFLPNSKTSPERGHGALKNAPMLPGPTSEAEAPLKVTDVSREFSRGVLLKFTVSAPRTDTLCYKIKSVACRAGWLFWRVWGIRTIFSSLTTTGICASS